MKKILILIIVTLFSQNIFADENLDKKAREINKKIRCVVCQSQSIDDSDSLLARDLRMLIKEKLKEKLRLLFTLFQVIGVIYFIKAIYMLKEASEGSQQTGYGKIILMIFASALVIDMPHTIDMLINTIQSWNETV